MIKRRREREAAEAYEETIKRLLDQRKGELPPESERVGEDEDESR